ncbi:uncharacterized protein LOC134825287 [Bolinopsis microptera]|uniref:uncharacterized protein LOC134825287 n=1 Tax=Bolinopsis microptera TaxID=2820187 RepID=UPI00307A2557
MLVFIDRCTGEDHFSDAYAYEELFGGAIVKAACKWGHYSNNEDVVLAGSNPSAEDGEEAGTETSERKIDLVHQFKLVECNYMNKKGFKEWLTDEDNMTRWKKFFVDGLQEKDYKLSDEDALAKVEGGAMKEWKKELTNFAKFILPQWKNVMVYHDVKEDLEGAKIFYIGDGEGDNFYYINNLYRTEKF